MPVCVSDLAVLPPSGDIDYYNGSLSDTGLRHRPYSASSDDLDYYGYSSEGYSGILKFTTDDRCAACGI